MKNIPNRCENCIFVQYDMTSDEYHCHNPCCAIMDTQKPGRCKYHITEGDLNKYYKARISNELTSKPTTTSLWTRAIPCKFMDDGYCKCEHLVESVRRSVNNADYNPDCLFVGIWNQARVVCMAYEKKEQRFEVVIKSRENERMDNLLGVFDSRERAEKFIKERIEIVEVE